MGKITVPNVNTQFDPVAQHLSTLTELGISPISSDKSFSLNTQKDVLNSFSGIDSSEYGDNISLYNNDAEALSTLNEVRAQKQSATEQLMKGLGHIASTMGTEILKSPGYLLGGFGALTNDKSVIENIVDNNWVNAFEKLDTTIKDQIPVYLTRDVEEGNIGRKLMSSAWWATTGADGIGFLLSMYAPGRLVGALGAGEKIGAGLELLAKETKLAKTLTASNILKNTEAGAKITKKGIENINSFNAVALNTYIESASEAANTFDNVKKQYLESNPNASDDEASEVASNAAANVMKANVGVLLLSNVFDEIFLFKGFGKSAEETAKNSMLGKLFQNGVLNADELSKLKREGIKDFFGKLPKKLAANFAKEGLFEEGLQTKIQQHYEDSASGKTDAGFFDDVFGGYFESLMNDPDMQESVVLGGILGGGASIFSTASEMKSKNDFLFGKQNSTPSFLGKMFNKKEKQESKGFVNIMNENFINSTRTIYDIAEKDDNGKIQFENGKVKVNEADLKNLVDQKEGLLLLNQLHNLAILEGNKSEEDYFGSLLTYNYFLPFLQQEGGYEVLQQHISNQLVDLMGQKYTAATNTTPTEKHKVELKEKLLNQAAEYKKIYDEVDKTTNTELAVPVDSRTTYSPWKQTVRDRKMQSLVAFNSAKKALTEIQMQYPDLNMDITEEDLDTMSPVDIVNKRIAQAQEKEYKQRLDAAKAEYVRLSDKKSLREDYDKFKSNQAKLQEDLNNEVQKENAGVTETLQKQFNELDFEKQINDAGYVTKRSENVKGFYIPDERIILENDNERVVLEARYNASTKTVEYVTKDKAGKETKVTDASGQFTTQFISKKYRPVSKEQISVERKALALEERKLAQVKMLEEFIIIRNNKVGEYKKELESINKEIEDYTAQLEKTQTEINSIYNDKISGKQKTRQAKINKKELESTLQQLNNTINNLRNRKEYLEEIVPKVELLIQDYKALREEILNSPQPFSFKKEVARLEELINNDTFLSEIRDSITTIEKTLENLIQKRDAIQRVLLSHSVFLKFIQLQEKAYEKAYGALDNFFKDIPYFYSNKRLMDMFTSDPKAVVAGDTLLKNNIISNVQEITKWLNQNPIDRFTRFGKNEEITEQDVYNKFVDILEPYTTTIDNAIQQYPYTPEEIYDLRSQVFITSREIEELQKELNDKKQLLPLDDTYRKYLVVKRLLNENIEKRFNQIKADIEAKNVDSSQKQSKQVNEPTPDLNLRDIFLQHSLPQTPFSTTGKSVLYNKTGAKQGEDVIDENGFPVLNDNTFQRTWFYVIDKLADEISNYRLIPVLAKYDSSDELQRTIEANFPDESSRTSNDIFVFLADSKNNIIKVDNQGNTISSGGTPVFTSLRKAEELFPVNQLPRINPDYILSEYFNSLGMKLNLKYDSVKDRKVNDVVGGKAAREKLKSFIDNGNTVTDLLIVASQHVKTQYLKFQSDLISSADNVLFIDGVTKGYPLYQLDEKGQRKQNKPLSIFKSVKLKSSTFGTDQLEGGKLGVIVNSQIKVDNKFYSIPSGTTYLQFDNNEFVTLQSRNLNKSEIETVMYLLSLADTTVPLNTITVDLPKTKDGKDRYYFLNNRKIQSPLPVFFRKSQSGGESFSLLETMINYGLKTEGKNKKGEIYIQSGKVIFTTFNNESVTVDLKDLSEAVKTNNFKTESVKSLYDFLSEKRFNVHNTLLSNNPLFFYPVYEKGELSFKTDKTYYDFLLGDVLTTSATVKEGYPKRLQRNVIYSNQIHKRTEAANKPVAKAEDVKTVTEPTQVQKKTKESVFEKYVTVYSNAVAGQTIKTVEEVDTKIPVNDLASIILQNDSLREHLEDINETITRAEAIAIAETIKQRITELLTPKQTVEEVVEKVVEKVIEEQPKPEVKAETPAEKIARLRNANKVNVQTDVTPSVDKRVDVEQLLEEYIKNKIVQKNCK